MMQDNRFVPISIEFQHHDYLFDDFPFEIKFAYCKSAPYVNTDDSLNNIAKNRFEEELFLSETGAGNITYYPNQSELLILAKLYRDKELYTLIDDEVVCIKDNSLLYPFIARFKEGFSRGYFELKNNLEIEKDKQSVFNIAVMNGKSGLDTAYEVHNFNGHNIKFLSDELIYESGVKTGRNYRAWQIILDSPYLHIQLFRESEVLIPFYRWHLEREIEKNLPNDGWGVRKGLEILLTLDIDPKLLEKAEKKMLMYGSLKPAVRGGDKEKEFKLIKDATPKEAKIIEAFKVEMAKPLVKKESTALSNLGRRTDLGIVGKNDKNRTDQIRVILQEFGVIKKKSDSISEKSEKMSL
jgi:hypothetical protein